MAEHLVEAGLDPRRDGALEPHRLLVRLGPAEADDGGQQPLEQRVAAEDRVGGGPAGASSGGARGPRRARPGRRRTSRRNISLAAWVVTPRWRAICAAVTRLASSGPTSTRSASRYSWAAADRSRWSWRRGMPSGYRDWALRPGACARRRRAMAETGEPGRRPAGRQDRARPVGHRRRRRPRSRTGRGDATTVAEQRDRPPSSRSMRRPGTRGAAASSDDLLAIQRSARRRRDRRSRRTGRSRSSRRPASRARGRSAASR